MQFQDKFDITHFHTDHLYYPCVRRRRAPVLSTLHGRLDIPDYQALDRVFSDLPVSSISDAQRRPLPLLNWWGTVHHGLPKGSLAHGRGCGGYLAFLGRISPEKGIDHAVAIAHGTGLPLKVAAKVENIDRAYFDSIHHLFDSPLVEFVGEIGDSDKAAFLGDAAALLFPIRWPEPFGLVTIEAMACGTPILAFRCGAVPEVIDDGVSGRVVDDIEQEVEAIGDVLALDRLRCRITFEKRFSACRMANDYLGLYRQMSPMTAEITMIQVN